MPVCTYDNPMSMMRECWQDGKLQAAYSAKLYALKKWPIPPHLYHIGANIGDFNPGSVWGDITAMYKLKQIAATAKDAEAGA